MPWLWPRPFGAISVLRNRGGTEGGRKWRGFGSELSPSLSFDEYELSPHCDCPSAWEMLATFGIQIAEYANLGLLPMQRMELSPFPRRCLPLAWVAASAMALSFWTPSAAHALQGGEDASTLPVLLEKQNGLGNGIQLSAMFATTLSTKFTDSVGGVLAAQYMFTDWIGVEVTGGFFGVNESQTLGVIRGETVDDPPPDGPEPQLSDMAGIQWLASANVVFVPVYGKISFAAEWNPSFDFFLTAGGGVVGANRGFSDPSQRGSELEPATTETTTEPQFNFGGGLRFFLIPELALRLEARTYFFTDPGSGTVLVSDTGTTEEVGGFTNALFGQVGLQWNL